MREIKSNKNSFFKKIFIKICRLFGVELIDQSNFSIPTSNKSINENLSLPGKKSITLPIGKIDIIRPVRSLNIILVISSSQAFFWYIICHDIFYFKKT